MRGERQRQVHDKKAAQSISVRHSAHIFENFHNFTIDFYIEKGWKGQNLELMSVSWRDDFFSFLEFLLKKKSEKKFAFDVDSKKRFLIMQVLDMAAEVCSW